jgi:replicative DNA helicase
MKSTSATRSPHTSLIRSPTNAPSRTATRRCIDVPPIPRLVADDITPEATASLLADQKGRMAVMSAEGGIFDIIGGRYSAHIPNLDVFLKGHAGDPVKIDRKGRPPEYIRRPALTLGLMIQPAVLTTIAANRQFRGRGLLARFLYAYPKSKVGAREPAPPPPDPEVVLRYEATVFNLAQGMSAWLSDPAVLVLTPDAQEAVLAIETAVEPTLADDGELASAVDWGAKYVGALARIAGNLHLVTHGAEAGPVTAVSAATILAAWHIGEYYKACAINAFVEMGADPVTADAVYLLGRISRLGQAEVSERDMHVAVKSRLRTKEVLLPAVQRLVDHGYLAPIPVKLSGARGRPSSPCYKVWEYRT